MSYIEFEIGGSKRGFRLGLGFIGDILDHFNTDMIGFGQLLVRNPFSATPAILYHAHKKDVQRKGGVIDFELNDFEDWIDELPNTLNNKGIESVLLALMDSIKKHLPKVEGDSSKKK